ncbi:MAG: iron-sulfur cluster repair di-iron protein [Kiritimatiellia bacterium]
MNIKSETHNNSIQPEMTLGEVVVLYPQLRERLEQLGLDYCCGGKRSLAEAVQAVGLDLKKIVAKLEHSLAAQSSAESLIDWAAQPLTILANHILETHHVFTKTQLTRIDALLTKVANTHLARHGRMLNALRNAFDPLKAELESHLPKEEQILFPSIKAIDAFMTGQGVRPVVHCGSVAYPIQQMEHEHDSAGDALVQMREITDGYRLPDDACQTFKALYEAIAALEDDLHQHIHLENNILFPASIRQEEAMGTLTI